MESITKEISPSEISLQMKATESIRWTNLK